MTNLENLSEELSSLENFLEHRRATAYSNEKLSSGLFGFEQYKRSGFIYPEQSSSWWHEYPDILVDLSSYRVMSERDFLYSDTVVHYLMTPLLASSRGNTLIDGLVPHALYSERNRAIYLMEGNHRCAAAAISGRPLLMRLAPFSKVPIDYATLSIPKNQKIPAAA